MEQFFTRDFTGASFVIFSTSHLIAIGIIILLNLSFLFLRCKDGGQLRRVFPVTAATILILNEVSWHLWNWATGQWTVQKMLPLHVCSLLVFASAYMLVTRNYRIYEFAYFMGIAGAAQAILTPDLGIYGFPHYRFYQTFISHGLIVTAAIYMTVVEGFRPTWRSLGRVIVWSNIYMVIVGVINWLIGSNYMFIAHKPETPSLIDMLGPWPWYILALEGIGFALFFLLYLPFAVRDATTSRAGASARSAL